MLKEYLGKIRTFTGFEKNENRNDWSENQILPRIGQRLSAKERIKLFKYKFKIYGPKSIDDILESRFG